MKNCNKHEPHTEVYTKHEDDSTDNLRQDHIGQMAMLQNNLSSFERNVENLRKTVVDGNRKLKMIEVEGLTNNLTNIGRTAAKLKTDYPVLYNKIESEIKKNMEKVIRDETFIKEEHQHIDNCLKRCKTLANMMVTMKKLAMVQDPTIAAYTSKLQQGNGTGVSGVFNASKPPMPKPILVNRSDREYSADSEKGDEITIMAEPITVLAPPVPPAPTNYQPPETKTFPSRNNVHVLDSILDELSSTEMDDEPSRIKVQINGKGSTYIPKHRSENTSNNYSTNNDDLKKKQNELDRQFEKLQQLVQ
uniref:BLOC-1-related complex subunit 5 n=1 Tax=Rhabditophanes sp. KR3021 TaxID=114890 RepID=A0AC35TPJ6_9BILA